jgi:hypothetical protein
MDELPNSGARRSPWHIYPADWKIDSWLVPYIDENAVIHHGHQSADDHSLCGPMVFCCARSRQAFLEMYPDSALARASWERTEAAHILSWLDAGVNVVYFVFCDPIRPLGLLAGGLSAGEARLVLSQKVLLEQYAEQASRLK